MNSGTGTIVIAELTVEVVRKNIKHAYIRVNRTDGRVRVSAPRYMDDQAVRVAVAARLDWIRRQQQRLAERETRREHAMVTGETHYLQGRPYRLEVVERSGRACMEIVDEETVQLGIRPEASGSTRRTALEQWYRRHLSEEIPGLIPKWERLLGVDVAEWRIKRMKTRWGTCNIIDRRIWLNLELARQPRECLEYVLLHEMVHLLERSHGSRFYAYMDRFMPDWRLYRGWLHQAPNISLY